MDELAPYKTQLPDCVWPVIPEQTASRMLAAQFLLEQTQWWSASRILRAQSEQLQRVLQHAKRTVPFYQTRLRDLDLSAADLIQQLTSLPVLTRADVQSAGNQLLSQDIPVGHQRLNKIQTSGSTGRPITAYGTDVTRFYWQVFTLREHLWRRRDLSAKFMGVRPEMKVDINKSITVNGWGPATDEVFATGPSVIMNSGSDVARQVEVMLTERPAYLLSLPSNLRAIIDYCCTRGLRPEGLREIRTYGESVSDDFRQQVREVWDLPVNDIYSSQEVGCIALQCPEHEHYHLQSENLLVEVLNEHGQSCQPGETGRVVVTTLQNFAMPLIRYEIGDYAEVGAACDCGRGLPVVNRILGRTRNMVRLPDGSSHWPSFPSHLWANLPDVRQMQLVQKNRDDILVRVVSDNLSDQSKQVLTEMIVRRLRYPFNVQFEVLDQIERSRSGKFEDFVSELTA